MKLTLLESRKFRFRSNETDVESVYQLGTLHYSYRFHRQQADAMKKLLRMMNEDAMKKSRRDE